MGKSKEYEWEVVCIRSSRGDRYGQVSAPDAETAISRAIVEFEIADLQVQERLAARRIA